MRGWELIYAYCIHRAVLSLVGNSVSSERGTGHYQNVAEFFDLDYDDVWRIIHTRTARRKKMRLEINEYLRDEDVVGIHVTIPSRINEVEL